MSQASMENDLVFLNSLRERGIDIRVDGSDIVCRANPGSLTDDDVLRLRRDKSRLVGLMQSMERDEELPLIEPDPEHRFEPFPLTENQEAYWLGRSDNLESGGVGIHQYFELQFENFDSRRFANAWQEVIRRHPMLRAVILPDGTQRMLEGDGPVLVEEEILPEGEQEREAVLERARREISHMHYTLLEWPQFRFKAFHFPHPGQDGNKQSVLMGGVDLWCVDLRSLQVVCDDLADLYLGKTPGPAPGATFRDYIMSMEKLRDMPVYRRSLEYWRERIPQLPPAPSLPLNHKVDPLNIHFTHHSKRFPASIWSRVRERASLRGLTASSVLLACYASIISRWSINKHFTLNIPRYNRLPLHQDINEIVGEFASFSLLEVDNSQQTAFQDLASRIQAQNWSDLAHSHVSGVRVLREWKKHLGSAPAVMAPFVFTNEPEHSLLSSREGETPKSLSWIAALERMAVVRTMLTQTPQVWVDSQFSEIHGELYIFWDSIDAMFPDGMVDRMFEAYAALVESLSNDEAWTAVEIPLPPSEIALRSTLIGPSEELPGLDPWEAMRERGKTHPDSVAVVDAHGSLTWEQACLEVNDLAKRLVQLGIADRNPVAFAFPKGRNQLIASMAVHAVGAVIVPLDHESPQGRINAILADSGSVLLLTEASIAPAFEEYAVPVMIVDAPEALPLKPLSGPLTKVEEPLYCMIYTSGTTGGPKGVKVPLPGLLNMLQDAALRFQLDSDKTILSLNPVYHDLALFDITGSALFGWRLVFPWPSRLKDPGHWLDLMEQNRVDLWMTVPATMVMLLDYIEGGVLVTEALMKLDVAFLGGDWIPLDTPRRLKRLSPSTLLVSIGGPTEVTVWNLLYPVRDMDPGWRSIPYGFPIQNAAYHLLDERLEDCPAMVTGEMYCSGAGVTAGYMGDPESTKAAYIIHPISKLRMFRTGDLGRLHPEGYIEFVGRRDNRVNINGYRIEPGEIENALGMHPAINQTVAVVQEKEGRPFGLALWVVLKPGHEASTESLRQHLAELLPKHMMPSFIGIAEAFPLNQNNKIDRRTIAGWETARVSDTAAEPPATATEQMLAEAWQNLLGCGPVHRDQNFFESGGNSISAVRLFTSVIAGNYEGLSVASVFTHPTLRSLAEALDRSILIEGDEASATGLGAAWPHVLPLTSRPVEIPATRMQRRMFYEDQRLGTNCYNMSLQLSIPRNANPAALEKAFSQVVRRHEILRTVFSETGEQTQGGGGQVLQHILPEMTIPVEVAYASYTSEEAFLKEAEDFCMDFTMRPFALDTGPLVRLGMLVTDRGRAECFIAYHHLALDGWSLTPLLEELAAAFENRELPLPRLHQADVAAWEESPGFAAAVEKRLPSAVKRFSASGSPSVLPSPLSVNSASTEASIVPVSYPVVEAYMPSDAVASIAAQAEAEGLTSFSVMCTLFGLLLAEYNGGSKAQFGTFTAARTVPGLEEPLGAMTCPSPLFLDFSGDCSLAEASRETLYQLSSSMEEVLLPFEQLVHAVSPHRGDGDLPFFGIAFTHDNTPAVAIEAGEMTLIPSGSRQYRSSIDLEAAVSTDRKGTRLALVYNPEKYRHAVVADFAGRFIALVSHAAENIRRPLKGLRVERPEEQAKRLSWSRGKPVTPTYQTVVDYFRAAEKKFATELLLKEVWLGSSGPELANAYSLADLGRMADSMSAVLQENGFLPGDHVILRMGRCARFAAAMLAVMQCGGSFIPVPLSLEEGRLKHIRDVSGARFLWQDVESDATACIEGCISLPLLVSVTPGAVPLIRSSLPSLQGKTEACIIFTSGSTGFAKGVRLTHENWVNRLETGWSVLPYGANEACIAKTSIGFVDIFCEFFQPLLQGVPVHVVAEGEERDVEALLAHMSHWRVSRAMIVASLISSMLDALAFSPQRWKMDALRHVTSSGERLSSGLAERFYRLLPQARIHNYYGSTEVTADVICGPVARDVSSAAGREVPLGRPMPNTLAAVVDCHGLSLPHGMLGEICIAGPCVSPGYAGSEEQKRIHLDGQNYFATGDLGIWTEDGELLGFGRADRQVKIRGQKVETGDVEEVIRRNALVADVCVFVSENAFQPVLQAAVVLREQGAMPMDALRRNLRPALGGPMMPSRFLELPAIPRTPSGKPDIPALRSMSPEDPSLAGEWKGSTERALVELWEPLIGGAVPGRDADFFSCGGHSLLAMRLVSLIRDRFNISLKVKDVFDSPVLADMAELIELLSESPRAREPRPVVREVI